MRFRQPYTRGAAIEGAVCTDEGAAVVDATAAARGAVIEGAVCTVEGTIVVDAAAEAPPAAARDRGCG